MAVRKRRPFLALSTVLVITSIIFYFFFHSLRMIRPSVLSFEEHQIKMSVERTQKEICRVGGASMQDAEDESLRSALHILFLSLGMVDKKSLLKALLHMKGDEAVVDIGAHRGYTLTFPALLSKRTVYAIEPDKRNFEHLSKKITERGYPQKSLRLVTDAVGNEKKAATMSFHTERDDYSCFNCLDTSRPDVYQEEVNVVTIDSIVKEPVHIYKSDTQGYELQVLQGSVDLFDNYGVRYAIIEFDPKLLAAYGTVTARDTIKFFLNRGYHCLDLPWRGAMNGTSHFASQISSDVVEDFLKELTASKAYTDLFCLRCLD